MFVMIFGSVKLLKMIFSFLCEHYNSNYYLILTYNKLYKSDKIYNLNKFFTNNGAEYILGKRIYLRLLK